MGERDPRLALFQDAHDLTFRKPGLPHSHSFRIARKSNILWSGIRGSLHYPFSTDSRFSVPNVPLQPWRLTIARAAIGCIEKHVHTRPAVSIIERSDRRVKAKQGFREFHAARRTIRRFEAMHMIRKGQDVRQPVAGENPLPQVVGLEASPPVGLSLATRSPGVGSQPCGAKYPRFCADSKGV